MTSDGWTLDELVTRVAAALGDGYPGAPNGRVRDVPDARAIRWYSTIGLVDKPAATRGRTALYGERHLLQLVAVKRRQADGRSIAEIQAELAGASEATLRLIAALPGLPPTTDEPAAIRGARFWTERPAPPPEQAPPEPAAPGQPAPGQPAPEPAAPGQATPGQATPEPAAGVPARTGGPWRPPTGALLTGVPLEGGAVLLLPAAPDPGELAAIAAAARPLLDLLSAHGLLRSEP